MSQTIATIILVAAGLVVALVGCGNSSEAEPSQLPLLTCHEHEVAVWSDYPVAYRCVSEDDHAGHAG